MNKKTTPALPSSSSDSHRTVATTPPKQPLQPSAQSLAFIRSLARNYRADSRLPQGLQGIILG